jgi:hypothetical protein
MGVEVGRGVAAGISAIQRALDDPGQVPDPYFDLEMTFEGDKADWLCKIQGIMKLYWNQMGETQKRRNVDFHLVAHFT